MPLRIVREDITRIRCDAIVNATDPSYSGSGGVDAAIHAAAGPGLRRACARLAPCAPGEARLTAAYRLPCKYVIHTVGPVWHGGERGEEAVLRSCYRRALTLARERGCRSVAFPAISSEALGYPKELALHVASDEIGRFLLDNDMDVTLAVFGRESFLAGKRLFADVAEYIDQNYADTHRFERSAQWRPYDREADADLSAGNARPIWREEAPQAPLPAGAGSPRKKAGPVGSPVPKTLAELLKNRDESFSQMLLRKIDEKGMTDVQCYKKANIDRKLFSKIRKDAQYRPSKATALAFAVALELPLEEARELLEKAGYAFSHSSTFDLIVEYFIRRGDYNIFAINEVLFYYDQSLLGS